MKGRLMGEVTNRKSLELTTKKRLDGGDRVVLGDIREL